MQQNILVDSTGIYFLTSLSYERTSEVKQLHSGQSTGNKEIVEKEFVSPKVREKRDLRDNFQKFY